MQPSGALYSSNAGIHYENVEVPVLQARPPFPTDVIYPIGKRWIDTLDLTVYTLVGLTSAGGQLTAIWDSDSYNIPLVVSGTSQLMVVNGVYIPNNAALVTFTLPQTASVGQIVQVVGFGAGGWTIAQNAGQTIHGNGGTGSTTTGITGSLSSTGRYNSVELMNVVTNTDWVVMNQSGTLTAA